MVDIWQLIAVLAFIGVDFLTGLISSLYTKAFQSSVMREGMYHKLGEILTVAFAIMVDYFAPMVNISLPFTFLNIVTAYIVIMEIGSIIENIKKFSPDTADVLTKLTSALKTDNDETKGAHTK